MSVGRFLAQLGGDHMGGWGWLAIVAMVAMMGGMGWMMWSMVRRPKQEDATATEDPVELLRRRYAAGELSTDEFRERLQAIDETAPMQRPPSR